MFYIAKKLLYNDTSLAEDAVHDAFLSIAKNMNRIEGEIGGSRVKAYVITVLKSRALNLLKKRNKIAKNEDSYDTEDSLDIEYELSYTYNYNEDIHNISKYVSALPDKLKTTLLLHVYYGMNEKEIAEALDISHANARKRMSRARAFLKSKFENEV
jgi:RNA polymerase sigma factor (sigma-70 family)